MCFDVIATRLALCFLIVFSGGFPVSTLAKQSVAEPSTIDNLQQLTDIAEVNLQRQAMQQPAIWVSNWLSDAPVLSASLLKSQKAGGSDEIELALTLPLKSPARTRLDDNLIENEQQLTTSLLDYRRWYASGLIRDIVWAIKLEQTKQRLLNEQLALYQAFINKLEASRSAELGAYNYYLYKQGSTELKLEMLSSEQNEQNARQQLRNLTGQDKLPKTMLETETDQSALQQHPRLQLLLFQAQQLQLQLEAGSSANTAWNLTTTLKQVNTPGFNDKQIGLRFDIPLSFGNQTNQQDSSTYQQAYQDWLNSYSDALLNIEQQYQTARRELNTLKQQRMLLGSNKTLHQAAKDSLLLLLERQEINPDLAQQRLQQLLQAELQLAIVDINIQHAIATLNQHAGVML